MSMLLFRTVIGRHGTPATWLLRSQMRCYAVGEKRSTNISAVSAATDRTDVSTDVRPIGERIKENTKTVSYIGVIAIGLAVTGGMFFAIFRELLSSVSPNNVYSSALDKCINVGFYSFKNHSIRLTSLFTASNISSMKDARVQDSLGAPIKGFGEESRRGRRQHVAHQMFQRNEVPHMRMQFYIQGIRNKATVNLEKNMVSNHSDTCSLSISTLNIFYCISGHWRIPISVGATRSLSSHNNHIRRQPSGWHPGLQSE